MLIYVLEAETKLTFISSTCVFVQTPQTVYRLALLPAAVRVDYMVKRNHFDLALRIQVLM